VWWSWRLAAAALAGFALIQLVPYGRSHTNPPTTAEPRWDSPERRPTSWLVQRDVDSAAPR